MFRNTEDCKVIVADFVVTDAWPDRNRTKFFGINTEKAVLILFVSAVAVGVVTQKDNAIRGRLIAIVFQKSKASQPFFQRVTRVESIRTGIAQDEKSAFAMLAWQAGRAKLKLFIKTGENRFGMLNRIIIGF